MIDVIIPCYNAHKTLSKTLDSIVKQTIKDKLKVLLVDDCSSEDYDSFVEKYKDKINISVYRLKKNSGPGIAREEGIKVTNGKYITFIDSDDRFYTESALEQLYNAIEEGYDLVKSIEYIQKLRGKYIINGNLHGKIYRREYLKKADLHFNSSRFHEDNFFNNLVMISGARTLNIAEITYYYTHNKKSITNTDPEEVNRLEILLNNYDELFKIFKERKYDKSRMEIVVRKENKYLRALYLKSNDKDKKRIKEMVYKHDKNAYSLLGLNYYYFIKNLKKYLSEISNQ